MFLERCQTCVDDISGLLRPISPARVLCDGVADIKPPEPEKEPTFTLNHESLLQINNVVFFHATVCLHRM